MLKKGNPRRLSYPVNLLKQSHPHHTWLGFSSQIGLYPELYTNLELVSSPGARVHTPGLGSASPGLSASPPDATPGLGSASPGLSASPPDATPGLGSASPGLSASLSDATPDNVSYPSPPGELGFKQS